MSDDGKVDGYFGYNKPTSNRSSGFCYYNDLSSVKTYLTEGVVPKGLESDDEVKEDVSEEAASLITVMEKAVALTHGQGELIVITQSMRNVFQDMLIKTEILDRFAKDGEIVEDCDEWVIFSSKNSPRDWFVPAREKLDRNALGLSALPQSVFMGMIATFDSSTSETVRALLGIKSERFESGAKTVLLSDVINAKSIQEIIDKVVDDELYLFSRGSHEEQVKFIESNFHIEIIKDWKRWPDFIEIFERRNLVAHGETKFTSRYADICTKARHKGAQELIGKEVHLRPPYLFQCLDILLEFSLLLTFTFWRKHLKNEEQAAFSAINEIIYKLIEHHRYQVAIRVSELVLTLKNVQVTDVIRRMLTVNLASAYSHIEDQIACNRVLDGLDWSASSDDFKICVASLRKDVDEVIELIPSVVASGKITQFALKRWPVFDGVRSDDRFAKTYNDMFDDDLATVVVTQDEGGVVRADDHAIPKSSDDPEDGTLH